jgi:undecaprenyl-diphosphatase
LTDGGGRAGNPVIVVGALAAAALFVGLLLLVRSAWSPLIRLDTRVAVDLHRMALRHHPLTVTMRGISAAGTTPAWLLILTPFVVWLISRRRLRLAGFVLATAILSSFLNSAVKAGVHRARPHLPNPLATARFSSFPSGHAQAAVVCVGLIGLILLPAASRRARTWLVITGVTIVVAIGFSRLVLGVHYLSDVVGGYLLGTAWLLAAIYALRLISRTSK